MINRRYVMSTKIILGCYTFDTVFTLLRGYSMSITFNVSDEIKESHSS